MKSQTSPTTTVAFEVAALKQLAHPGDAFTEMQFQSMSTGLVSDLPTYAVTSFARRWGIDYGFHSGPRTLLDSLVKIRTQPEHQADRYLLIATEGVDRSAVLERGWAFLPLLEAAETAAWPLAETDDDDRHASRSDGWP